MRLLVYLFLWPAAAIPTATSLEELLNRDDYIEFVKQAPRANHLQPEQKYYFSGVLAYRRGRYKTLSSG